MKKLYFSLILASVSSIALAQTVTPEAGIAQMVKNNVMSADVNYEAEPTLTGVANGFEVFVPQGSMKFDETKKVDAFTIPVIEDGEENGNKRYFMRLDSMSQIFPTFEKLLNEKNATYSTVDYFVKFIPTLQFVEEQELTMNDLKLPFEGNFEVSVASMKFSDVARMLSETTVNQEEKVSFQGFTLMHPMVALTAESFDFNVLIPETAKAKSPLDQVLQTPNIQQNMSLKDGKIRSIAFGQGGAITFNMDQQLDVRQDVGTQNVTLDFKLGLNDITQNIAPMKTPSQLVADFSVSGFTVNQVVTYSEAMNKMNETKNLPESSRKDIILGSIQKEVDDAENALKENMIVDINEVAVNADEYAVVLSGKATPKDEVFRGFLQVTNFAYLAPEPKNIDEAACKELVEQMMENKIDPADFRSRYEATCDEGRGVLDALRPYAASAQEVKDKQGRDALRFAVEVNGEDLFINGSKVEDKNLNPNSLLGL